MRRTVLSIVSLALAAGTLAFVIYLSAGQSRLNAETNCWFALFDRAVNHAPAHGPTQAQLRTQAEVCARLP